MREVDEKQEISLLWPYSSMASRKLGINCLIS